MKVKYEVQLPEEQSEAEILHNATNMWSFLWDLQQTIRGRLKYSEDENYGVFVEEIYRDICAFLDKMEVE